ncbi:PaaI family thioesterase [Desulfonatronum sp. SC1]|uniref:PaaI family thioesterase n=1 Tax=Desulfonatronum sp. SC1 TaxID=2109626 RepID=UPI000D31FC53|nr:PaaI family thioesterase [Desulfonatronum sp. SC1]PTN33509.1 thioesterase [Desulfonatronum sp. SC1]
MTSQSSIPLPIQHQYADELSHCYGCGRNNPDGLQVKSFWDGQTSVARFTPKPEHIAVPGFVYGGLLASLVDCHGVGTAAAGGADRAEGEPLGRYVTASLHVDFLRPTPLGVELELRGRVRERKRRKLVVEVEILVNGVVTVRGEVVAAPMPANMELQG